MTEEKIIKACARVALKNNAFFGMILWQVNFVASSSCETMCQKGTYVEYSRDWIKMITPEELEKALKLIVLNLITTAQRRQHDRKSDV